MVKNMTIKIIRNYGSFKRTYEFDDKESAERFISSCRKSRKNLKIEGLSEDEAFLKRLGR